ncbi:MAG: ROK family protein [Verrucomicrobiota bacterium]|jgi:glucokinase
METFLGVEIGGTKLQLVLADEQIHVAGHRRFAVEPAQGADGIRRNIEHAILELGKGQRFDAVGVGFGGPVDWRKGKIARSHQIAGWSGFELGSWLERLAAAPVFVDNDANVAALGEATHGAGRGFNPAFYVTLGSGVGGGLIMDGNIYHGAAPGESEIGHIRLDRAGTILESRCSGWSVDARIRELKKTAPESLLARLAGDTAGGEARFLAVALQQGDAPARRLLREVAEDLAFGLSHVVQLLHPEVIVLGGGLAGLGEPLRSEVAESLRPLIMEVFRPGPEIRLAALGEAAVPTGAIELARRNLR